MNHTDKGKFKEGERKVGRRKGVPNKVTAELRDKLSQIFTGNFTQALLDEMPPDRRAELLLKLLPYIIPKYADLQQPQPQENEVKIIIDSPLRNRAPEND